MKHLHTKFQAPSRILGYFFVFSFFMSGLGFSSQPVFAAEVHANELVQAANNEQTIDLWAASETVLSSNATNLDRLKMPLNAGVETSKKGKKVFWKKAIGITAFIVLAAALMPRDMTMSGGENSGMNNLGFKW